jgi:NAD(P)-dependent dehydrogenase (short-subunit alcohol dehydrogenase family)
LGRGFRLIKNLKEGKVKVENKVAVITGGASGIGLAIGKALVEKGARVMLADIKGEEAAKEAAAIGKGTKSFQVDVARLASVEELADKAWSEFGQVDLLFNNAGIAPPRRRNLLEVAPEDMDRVIDVNLKGVWRGSSVFGKRFIEQKTEAVICNTGSEHSLGFAHPLGGIYTATKHAVLGLSDVLRHELPDFIHVSVFCPGAVKTKMTQGNFGMEAEPVGKHVVSAIERGDFLIVTHPHVVKLAEKRWEEISSAFQTQAPYTEESEKYNVLALMERMRKEK